MSRQETYNWLRTLLLPQRCGDVWDFTDTAIDETQTLRTLIVNRPGDYSEFLMRYAGGSDTWLHEIIDLPFHQAVDQIYINECLEV